MTENYKKMLALLPTANSEEIKIMAKRLYHIIDCLEESIKLKDGAIERLRDIIESKDDRIETLKETIDLLENQRKRQEFEKVYKGKLIWEA